MWKKMKSKETLQLNGCGSEWAYAFPISVTLSLGWKLSTAFRPGSTKWDLLWGGKNGAVIKQNFGLRNRKWVYAKNEGGVIWAQAEEHSAPLIHSGLDSCMWIESSLSLRTKQKDKWQSTSLEREEGIAQLVLRWVVSFIRRGRCSKCLAPWRKGWFRARWVLFHWPSALEQIWWDCSKFIIIHGVNYLRKRKMVKT